MEERLILNSERKVYLNMQERRLLILNMETTKKTRFEKNLVWGINLFTKSVSGVKKGNGEEKEENIWKW